MPEPRYNKTGALHNQYHFINKIFSRIFKNIWLYWSVFYHIFFANDLQKDISCVSPNRERRFSELCHRHKNQLTPSLFTFASPGVLTSPPYTDLLISLSRAEWYGRLRRSTAPDIITATVRTGISSCAWNAIRFLRSRTAPPVPFNRISSNVPVTL